MLKRRHNHHQCNPNPNPGAEFRSERGQVEHHREHPDIHEPWHVWSEEETLHVAVPYSNPYRWQSRRELFNDFRRHMTKSPNICLHVGELAYGDRPFEVTDPDHCLDYQFRSSAALFHKENIQNAIIRNFPSNWKYGACVDGDFHFTRHDIGLETIHQLQHHPWVQMFSQYADLSGETLGQGHRLISHNSGFAFNYINNSCQLPEGYGNGGWKLPACEGNDYHGWTHGIPGRRPGVGATGGAWAFTRAGFEAVGSLLDVCILGHADWFMTFGLVGEEAPDMHTSSYSPEYRAAIAEWQRNAARINRNIGYVDSFAVHHFHGSKHRRAYSQRDTILAENQFNPHRHLKRDWQGIYTLNPEAVDLRNQIAAYFISRNEDDPNLYNGV